MNAKQPTGPIARAAWGLVALLLATAGGTCEFDGGGTPARRAVLDQTTVKMRIVESGSGAASVRATIETSDGETVELRGDQAVLVNDTALSGPGGSGSYEAQVAAADVYAVTVREPTRGVLTTSVAAPGDFALTAPASGATASLSGFTLEWSNPDAGLSTTVLLAQTILSQSHTASFGPAADTGALSLSASDLAEFQQGADIAVVITRSRTQQGINGTASGTVVVERSRTGAVTPGP